MSIPEILKSDLLKLNLKDKNYYLFTSDGIAPTEVNEIQRRNYFTKQFKQVKEHFNLPKEYTMYSFRHTFITKLYRELRKKYGQNETLDHLSLITGHTTFSALQKYLRDIDAELPDDYSEMFK